MHLKKKSFLALLSLICLTSCGKSEYQVTDYRLSLTYHDGFKIMQLTDLHIAVETDLINVESLVTSDITEASPDLLVLTGDTFMQGSKDLVNNFLSYIDSFDIPFAFTYGNHDFQGNYDQYYIERKLMETKNALYVDYKDDDIFGLSNYYIDLVSNTESLDNPTKFRLYIIDSNSYHLVGAEYEYDVIHEDQIAHMEAIASQEGEVPSLAFYHIPIYEYADAYAAYEKGEITGKGTNEEKVSVGYKRTDFFQRTKDIGVIGNFIGHDHINDSDLLYQDVLLSYGVKSSEEIYNDDNKVGYKLITLNYTDSYSASDLYSSVSSVYQEVK